MENLFWAFMALQWWEYAVLFIIIYFLLGLYGAIMFVDNSSHTCQYSFWSIVLLWWAGLFVNFETEVVPYYRKCKLERIKKRITAKIKKYGLPELKTD